MARMPLRHTTRTRTGMNVQTPNSIGMRMTRKNRACCRGSGEMAAKQSGTLFGSAFRERIKCNCGLVPSTMAEQRETRKGNAGKFLNRAGKKALTSGERAKREEIQERWLSKKNKDDSESPGGGVLVEGTRSGCKGKASNLMSTASGSLMPKKSDTRSTWQARQS